MSTRHQASQAQAPRPQGHRAPAADRAARHDLARLRGRGPFAATRLRIERTGPAVVQTRERGLRWERIAADAGVTVKQAHALDEEASGQSYRLSHTGRGRNFAADYAAAQVPKRTRRTRKAAPEQAEA